MNELIFCTGFKGGIGKSFMTAAVVDYLSTINDNIIVVDTDSTIPDVYKTFKDTYKTYTCNLFTDEGWSALLSICNKHDECQIVVNCAAGSDETFIKNIHHIELASEILERKIASIFMLNDEKDSMNKLCQFFNATHSFKNHHFAVIKNGYSGDDSAFGLYNTSKLKIEIESTGGISYYLPALTPHVRQKIKLERKSFADAAKILSFGDRIFLDAWRKKVHDFLRGFLDA